MEIYYVKYKAKCSKFIRVYKDNKEEVIVVEIVLACASV